MLTIFSTLLVLSTVIGGFTLGTYIICRITGLDK